MIIDPVKSKKLGISRVYLSKLFNNHEAAAATRNASGIFKQTLSMS